MPTISHTSLNAETVNVEVELAAWSTTGKFIEAEWALYERYEKAMLWAGDNGSEMTVVASLRVPNPVTRTNSPFLYNGNIDFSFQLWSASNKRFYINVGSGSGGWPEWTVMTADSGLDIGDWFTLMISFDYSTATPTREVWLHKVGDVSATDLRIGAAYDAGDAGPVIIDFDDTAGQVVTVGAHPSVLANCIDFEETNYYISNEFVDFSDPAERAKVVDGTGKPIYLGDNGELLTGTAAKLYAPDGDFTAHVGTEGQFAEVGTISNSTTSPTD